VGEDVERRRGRGLSALAVHRAPAAHPRTARTPSCVRRLAAMTCRRTPAGTPCRHGWRTNHERLKRWLDRDDLVEQAGRETAELAAPDADLLTINLHDQSSFEHDEHFVALRMEVRAGVGPPLRPIVEPHLQRLRPEGEVIRDGTPGGESRVSWQPPVVERSACAHLSILTPGHRRRAGGASREPESG
jgi:hypothetical protein